MLLKLII